MPSTTPKTLELLAPARNAEIAIAAIQHGADAVYIGAPSHGARAAAGNSVEDIAEVCRFAHRFGARVYVTLNTIIYDNELSDVEKLVWRLYRVGVDALIVQDMGLLRMHLPPIALHASTQCDTRTPSEAQFLEQVGFSQIVVARECSIDELRAICSAVKVPVEAFVHGALCVSYSGDCYASYVCTGRSANRGECAQMCRLPYDLVDADSGKTILRQKHLLSLRDMQRIDKLALMADAGVRSFKIEGRLKDIDYVKNVVAAYSRELDRLIAENPDKFRRLSYGHSDVNFVPDTSRSFNRGFTPYFLTDIHPGKASLASMLSPKSIGQKVATVKRYDPRTNILTADISSELSNGDGMGFFDSEGVFRGFRLNRVDGNRLYPASRLDPQPKVGTVLFRNSDVAWQRILAGDTASRTIDIDMNLWLIGGNRLVLDMSDERGCSATHTLPLSALPDSARSPQDNVQRSVMGRLGGTPYRLRDFSTLIPELFIPNSSLATLRREAIELLDKAWEASRPIERRRAEDHTATLPNGTTLTYHANVANNKARDFYLSHGASSISPAAETMPRQELRAGQPMTVMTTRYCLRRELGACLKDPSTASNLPRNLAIRGKGVEFSLDFDCRNCLMKVKTT